MKKYILYLIALIFISINSKAQNSIWSNSLGSNEFDLGNTITVDSDGNTYTAGQFRQTVDFDPGAGVFEMSSVGVHDMFVRKLDSDGNFIWAKSIHGLNYVSGHSIVVDASNNVYVVGEFWETVDFDPGVGTHNLTSLGNEDAFVLKLDSSGDFLWAHRFGSTDDDVARSISIDMVGNLYVTGLFLQTVDFDPGLGVAELSSTGPLAYTDVFVLKLNPNGDYIWCKSMGGDNSDMANGISTDMFNNSYVTGHFRDIADFDPGVGVSNLTSNGQYDVFVAKLDVNGNFLWAKSIGSADNDEGYGIVAQGPHAVYVTGYFSGTADFDPNAGTYNLTSDGGLDIFTLKLNADGGLAWAHAHGGPQNDIGTSVATDFYGYCYVTGQFYETVDFDPGVGELNLVSNGDADIFIQKLAATGEMDWTVSEGGVGNDAGKGITTYNSSFVHVIGGFKNTVDFNVDAAVDEFTSLGSFDIFEQKLGVAIDGLGVDSNSDFALTRVYPNPTYGPIFLEFQNEPTSNNLMSIFDAMGREILVKTIDDTVISLDLSNYQNGVYFIEITHLNDKLSRQRIVLNQ